MEDENGHLYNSESLTNESSSYGCSDIQNVFSEIDKLALELGI